MGPQVGRIQWREQGSGAWEMQVGSNESDDGGNNIITAAGAACMHKNRPKVEAHQSHVVCGAGSADGAGERIAGRSEKELESAR